MERAITGIYQRAGEPPPLPAADLARLLITVGAGARLGNGGPGSVPDAATLPSRSCWARLIMAGSRAPSPAGTRQKAEEGIR